MIVYLRTGAWLESAAALGKNAGRLVLRGLLLTPVLILTSLDEKA